jgi:hypothetical protein
MACLVTGCLEGPGRVIIVGFVVVRESASRRWSEQEVNGLLCGGVSVCGHPGKQALDRVSAGRS